MTLRLINFSSLVLIILTAGVSGAGVVFTHSIYPDPETSMAFLPTDMVNLVLGIPMISVSLYLTRKHKLIGLLFFPGALLYITYIYITYLFGLQINILFVPYLILVILSLFTLTLVFMYMNGPQVRDKLKGQVPLRGSGYLLFAIGCIIVIFQAVSILRSVYNQVHPDRIMVAQWITDLVVGSPALLITGLLMIRRKMFGYMAGTGVLLLMTVLFVGLIPVMIIEAALSGTAVKIPDLLIIAVSSLICVIPLSLFIKGILKVTSEP